MYVLYFVLCSRGEIVEVVTLIGPISWAVRLVAPLTIIVSHLHDGFTSESQKATNVVLGYSIIIITRGRESIFTGVQRSFSFFLFTTLFSKSPYIILTAS
jgi:hypothetical protein